MVHEHRIERMNTIVSHQWKQLCLNTSLHGWKYTVLSSTSKLERCICIAICCTSLGLSFILLSSAWIAFQSNPTNTLTESTQYPVYKFEFPAVTICSFNMISKAAAHEMTEQLRREVGDQSLVPEDFKMLVYLLYGDNIILPKEKFENLHRIIARSGKTVEEIFHKISPPCESMLEKCFWKGEEKRCDFLFQKVKTPIGYCCSFNSFALKNSTNHSRAPKKPWRTSACGYQSGLILLVNNDEPNYFATHMPSVGVRVMVHNPYDIPNFGIANILCDISTTNYIGVNPEKVSTTQEIEKKSITERRCLYPQERDLENFAVYNFHNCMELCRDSLIQRFCGCIPFYSSNEGSYVSELNICTWEDISCLAEYDHLIYNVTHLEERGMCDCIPDCERTLYTLESSKAVLDPSHCTNQLSICSNANTKTHTIIRVFFNDLDGTKHRRDVVFTWYTLMGYYGGILGLFTGFSFISVAEILYFFVIRYFSDKKTKNQKQNKVVVQPSKLKMLY